MSALDLDTVLATPLAPARAAAARGSRVVGYVGDDVPVELILAAHALPVRIEAGTSATPRANEYLESSFGPAHRSYLEQWLTGELDFMDAVVFARSNDAAQRLYYYLCELQRRRVCAGPRPLIYDVARIDRDTSRQHTIDATQRLAQELGCDTRKLDGARQRLRGRIALERRLAALRSESPGIAGSEALRAWTSLQIDWSEPFEDRMREWMANAPRQSWGRRLLLAGSTPPDARVHRAIEAGGGNVVDELFDGAFSQSVTRWDATEPTLASIADAYRSACTADALLMRSPTILAERARQVVAHGVVLWLMEQDEGIVWELPAQVAQLQAAKLPLLVLTRQQWNADAATLVQITRFVHDLPAS